MRARNIKPGFFDNEELAEGGPCAQILFEGLWCLADREGILENRPARIKAKLFPYYDPKDYGGKNIHELLNFLATKKFVRFYSADGYNLISITNFKKHQSPHGTEKASTFPPPPPVHGEITVNPPLKNGEPAETHQSTCVEIVLNPDLLIHGCTDSTRGTSVPVAEPAPQVDDADSPVTDDAVAILDDGGDDTSQKQPKFGPARLAELWNSLGCRPMVSELTDERRKKAHLRIRKRGDPDWWSRLFGKVKVLNRSWLTFDFLIRNDNNYLKVLEGHYDHDFANRGNGRETKSGPPRTPRGYDQRQDQYVIDVPDPD